MWLRAREADVISAEEFQLIERRNRLRDKVIRVDDFPVDFELREALCTTEGA
jgi:acyl-CoA dehydrogenase